MIEMLKHPEGATVEQIAAATGWQHHITPSAARSLARSRRSSASPSRATRTREVGPNKTGAKGSSKVYRIVEGG